MKARRLSFAWGQSAGSLGLWDEKTLEITVPLQLGWRKCLIKRLTYNLLFLNLGGILIRDQQKHNRSRSEEWGSKPSDAVPTWPCLSTLDRHGPKQKNRGG